MQLSNEQEQLKDKVDRVMAKRTLDNFKFYKATLKTGPQYRIVWVEKATRE